VVFVQRPVGAFGPRDPGNPGGFARSADGLRKRRQVEQFMFAFDSNLAPIVGQQVTMTAENLPAAIWRVLLFLSRAVRGECDVVAKRHGRGFVYESGAFRPDSAWDAPVSVAQLIVLATVPEGEVTFTCVPPGAGVRIGIDRDEDGVLDADDRRR
jgi:hypothetical protein